LKKISDLELKKVEGGMAAWVAIGIGLVVTFVAGVLDGIARPSKCHS
jgi:hypothetical protein